jgi:hypothetical protein
MAYVILQNDTSCNNIRNVSRRCQRKSGKNWFHFSNIFYLKVLRTSNVENGLKLWLEMEK